MAAIYRRSSEVEVEAERCFELAREMERNVADHGPDTFDRS